MAGRGGPGAGRARRDPRRSSGRPEDRWSPTRSGELAPHPGEGDACAHRTHRSAAGGGEAAGPSRSPSPQSTTPQRSRRQPPRGLTQRCSAARRPLQGTPRRPPPPPARPRSPRPPPRHATSYLQVTCFVQPPPLPSLPPPPPPAPGDRAATVGIGVREAAATAAAAAPAPDVVAVVPGAAASAITVYPTQQWPRNFRDHIVPVRLRG